MRTRSLWLVVSGLVVAATAVPAAAGTIGFLDAERAVATVGQGKAVLQQMEVWAKPRQERVEQLRSEVASLRDQILKQTSVASKEAIERLQEQELAARRRLEDATRELQRDYQTKQDELLKPVAQRLNVVVSDYAEANDLDAVLVFKPRTIVYLADSADITDEVIALYDQRFPAGG